jgi:hypothetical protein
MWTEVAVTNLGFCPVSFIRAEDNHESSFLNAKYPGQYSKRSPAVCNLKEALPIEPACSVGLCFNKN